MPNLSYLVHMHGQSVNPRIKKGISRKNPGGTTAISRGQSDTTIDLVWDMEW